MGFKYKFSYSQYETLLFQLKTIQSELRETPEKNLTYKKLQDSIDLLHGVKQAQLQEHREYKFGDGEYETRDINLYGYDKLMLLFPEFKETLENTTSFFLTPSSEHFTIEFVRGSCSDFSQLEKITVIIIDTRTTPMFKFKKLLLKVCHIKKSVDVSMLEKNYAPTEYVKYNETEEDKQNNKYFNLVFTRWIGKILTLDLKKSTIELFK